MIKVSSKCVYAVSALFDLASHYDKGPVRIEDIAHRQGIPSDFLRQLLVSLKKMRFVESVRGTKGGYVLAKKPAEINVLEVVESIEGPINFMGAKVVDTVLRSYWERCQDDVAKTFDGTLEDMLHEKQKREESIIFHI